MSNVRVRVKIEMLNNDINTLKSKKQEVCNEGAKKDKY